MIYGVIGAGAVGGYYGGRLAAGGETVHFLARSNAQALRDHGLDVKSAHGDFHVKVKVHDRPETLPALDALIVAVKGTATDQILPLIHRLNSSPSVVVCLQNGLGNEEKLASVVGEERMIAGAAFICSEQVAPGVVEHTAAGGLRLGWFAANHMETDATPEALIEVWSRCGVPPSRRGDSVDPIGKRIKWSKLIWNVPFNGLSVYYGGVTTDAILADPERLDFASDLMREVVLAATADGVTLDEKLVDQNMAATAPMGAYRTSMMVDFIMGRPLEHESILEEPLRRGQAAGLCLPAMSTLCVGVKQRLAERTTGK